MTSDSRLERALPEILADLGGISRLADDDAMLARATAARQRPAWAFPNRWLARDPLAPRLLPANSRLAVGLLLLLLVLIGAAVAWVGSQHRVPPPFGIARPGLIAFDLDGEIFVTNSDGTGRRQLTPGPSDGWETFSPDGTLIAYQTEAPDMSTSVVVMGPDGGHPLTVAEHLAEVGDIVWSPDSRQVAFGARILSTSGFRIFRAAVDHPGAVPLGGPDVLGREPSWSPDGRTLAFKRIDAMYEDLGIYAEGTLWLMNADGTHLRQLTKASEGNNALWNTQWSPDSRQLAVLMHGVGAAFDVYVVNADGTGAIDISNSPEEEYWPSWSPDGTRIAFARMSPTTANQGTVVIVDPDGSHGLVLDGPRVNSNPLSWSPDGTRVLGYAKNPDPGLDYNVAIAIFDASGSAAPTTIPADGFGSASWQRLAP